MSKVRLGNPLPLPTDEDVSPPTQAEIILLSKKWDANCPPFFVGLLDAQSTTDPNPTARFLYDKRKMQYIHRKTGRVITRKEIKEAFLYYIEKVA
jgi:hypothetical protein